MNEKRQKRRGFTLLELLVVVLIISILAGLVLSALAKARGRAKKTQTQAEAASLQNAIQGFHHEYGYWPGPSPAAGGIFSTNNDQVLAYLVPNHPQNVRHMPFWSTNGVAVDPYGSYYVITIDVNNNSVTVWSPNM